MSNNPKIFSSTPSREILDNANEAWLDAPVTKREMIQFLENVFQLHLPKIIDRTVRAEKVAFDVANFMTDIGCEVVDGHAKINIETYTAWAAEQQAQLKARLDAEQKESDSKAN